MRHLVFLAAFLPALLSAHPDPSHTLEQLEEHLLEAPDDAALLRQKADLLISTGHPELAQAAVGKLMSLAGEDPENLLLDARLAHAQADAKAALAKTNLLVATHPKFAGGWNFLARLENESGKRDEAIAAKRCYLELAKKPGPTDVLTCAGWLRERGQEGDAEAAIEVIDQGLAKLGCLTGLHYAAMEIELGLGLYDSALKRIDAITARYRPSIELALRRAEILEKASRFGEAAESCDSALALMEALPASRKKNAAYQQQLEVITKRKAENLGRVVE